MNWKDFLKPDCRKVILFMIIYLVLPWPLFFGEDCISYPYLAAEVCIRGPIFIPIIFLILMFESSDIIGQSHLILSYIIISYLLSCLMVWIYDKVRKKKS